MGETLVTVEELVAQSGGGTVDVTWVYEQWREKLAGMLAKINDRFELHLDESTQGLEHEGPIGSGIHGQVQCFAGPEIDWMVYSWMANPKQGFANLHITISPGPQVDLPIFGLAFACFGERPWGYIDLGARREADVNTEYFFKYYQPLNQRWLDLRRDNPQLDWFMSPSAYVRQVMSPVAFCYSGPPEQRTVDLIQGEADFMLDTWLGYFDIAEKVAPQDQPKLLKYTEDWRATVAELDPANSVAVSLFGQDITNQLVNALGGRNRTLPHAGAAWNL
mgnify:FL=1